jgi:hypothetical protein
MATGTARPCRLVDGCRQQVSTVQVHAQRNGNASNRRGQVFGLALPSRAMAICVVALLELLRRSRHLPSPLSTSQVNRTAHERTCNHYYLSLLDNCAPQKTATVSADEVLVWLLLQIRSHVSRKTAAVAGDGRKSTSPSFQWHDSSYRNCMLLSSDGCSVAGSFS